MGWGQSVGRGNPHRLEPRGPRKEKPLSYVYLKTGTAPDAFTVGFYDGAGKWQPESAHDSVDRAVERTHYLNGGSAYSENQQGKPGPALTPTP